MAIPIVSFKHESPLQFSCDAFREVNATVQPGAIGKGTLRLFITAPLCNFGNGTKEILGEFEAKNLEDAVECTFHVSLTCALPQIFTIILTLQVINAAGEVGNDRIISKVNCQQKSDTTTPANTPVIS